MKSFADILDTYELLEEIGKGGGGTVYKAYHNRLDTYVVLKKIHETGKRDSELRKEADILKGLHNRYLPQVIDYFDTDKGVFTVMSYVPGKTFQQLKNEGAVFSKEQLKKWTLQMLSALDYMHTRRPPVIHGDIKPSNVILTPEGDICLIDFNISLRAGDGKVLGFTNGFASPEQYEAAVAKINGRKVNIAIDQRSDIYSLGAFLYYILTGRKGIPYNKRNPSVNKEDFAVIRRYVGEPFVEVIKKAMAHDPADRYATAREMANALRSQSGFGLSKTTRTIAIAVIAVVLLAGSFVSVRAIQHSKYNEMVEQQEQCIADCDFAGAEENFEDATDILPRELPAYYQNARRIYSEGDSAGCLDYIENHIISNDGIRKKGETVGELYKLAGKCCIEQNDGERAVSYFEFAHENSDFDGADYRNYAVALARDGQRERAGEMIDKAEEKGAATGTAEYVRGQIAYSEKNYDTAIANFESCAKKSDDEELISNAYWMTSKIHKVRGDLQACRAALKEAKGVVSAANRVAITQSLAQVDINLADKTGDSGYRQEAAELLNDLVIKDQASKKDYHSLAVIYIKINELTRAENIIAKRGDKFGEDYDYYKMMAILEAHKQAKISENNRNYAKFSDYYDHAKAMYDSSLDDSEMEALDNIYNQIRAGGWI